MLAVLSGDLINSTQLEESTFNKLTIRLKKEFQAFSVQFPSEDIVFSQYRGDSFQGVVADPLLAFTIALQLKALVNSFTDESHSEKNRLPMLDVRISIGIGQAKYTKNDLASSNGEAFQLSGRTLDTMKAEEKTMALTTTVAEINKTYEVLFKFLDATTARWSLASAETIYYLLQNFKEQEIAIKVNRSQAAINHRKKAAGWDEIKMLLDYYPQTIKNYFL